MTPNDKIVEAVARAICAEMGDDWEREGPGNVLLEAYGPLARAAITAYQAEAAFDALQAAYMRGATWSLENGMHYKIEDLRKAAYDYADKTLPPPPNPSPDRSEP